ncbi:hypothetical protein CS0771_38070 [Catellatospora sp. IY07-71]|nr:hypothetical protein CS0771_38070 [Catellatospora sp. IY07-71]
MTCPAGGRRWRTSWPDCLWSVLVLARRYDFDLATEFHRTMDQLEQHVTGRLDALPSSPSH